jgi:ABC-type branched-subunit amino acid transport system substrate-binding protein
MLIMVDAGLPRRVVLGGGLGVAAIPLLGVAAAAGAGTGPLRVGVLVDLSGPASAHGKRQLLGMRFQADQINADRKVPGIELVVRDTQGDVRSRVRMPARCLRRSGWTG